MSDALDGIDVRAALLARLRFERLMGVETVRPAPLTLRAAPEPAVAAPAAQAAIPAQQTPRAQAAPAARPAPPISAPVPPPPAATGALFEAPEEKPLAETAASLSPEEKAARWSALEARAKVCQLCVLARGRTNVVFGVGDHAARLVFVGEGPGQDEDLKGEPFVGKAGQLLNKIIAAIGTKREDVYICNVVKCRPPENRTPLPDEIAACSPYLFEQLELVAPKVIVALGGPAAKTLLRTETGITRLRGNWGRWRGVPVMPTFHPAFVLRNYTEEVRRNVWDDMKKVMERLKQI